MQNECGTFRGLECEGWEATYSGIWSSTWCYQQQPTCKESAVIILHTSIYPLSSCSPPPDNSCGSTAENDVTFYSCEWTIIFHCASNKLLLTAHYSCSCCRCRRTFNISIIQLNGFIEDYRTTFHASDFSTTERLSKLVEEAQMLTKWLWRWCYSRSCTENLSIL